MVIAQKPITNSISDCVSISLAEESCWQRCADKLIAALPGITKVRRPFIALNLPEKPEIANELVSLECSQTHFRSKEWLKVVADDPKAVKELARYWSQDIFSDREASYMSHENHFGYAACAALCANKDWQPFRASRCMHIKKIAAVCWYKLTIRKSSAPCYWWLIKTNPACNVAKYSKNFPHATLAALAELLALKAPCAPWLSHHRRQKAACTAKST